MRTIKFKAICIDTGTWVIGYGVVINTDENIAAIIHRQGKNLMQHTAVEPATVCEYTGLKDKNGTDIFEGDKVQYHNDSPTVVKYENQGFIVANSLDVCISPLKIFGDENKWVVIGNIHDNKTVP